MLDTHNKRDKKHLINLIGKRNNKTPNFALTIGAGASASSGIRTSRKMIAEWHQQLYEESKNRLKFQEWLEKQDWYEDDDEYSILFEKVCDQPSQRRIYIEECVKDAKPAWGYIYLANIIANNYFNVIFTPNFDDLLNEACFIYADLRPLISAHDSAVSEIRVTSVRPKIIKLHGDFLYDSIKNTLRETETLEKNMRDKFMQFAKEYGLVVIGYGGNDSSIMDILNLMLRSEGYFPNGVYWCLRNEDRVSKRLKRLMLYENIYWVEIEGFDEFMAELHGGLELKLPDAVRDPYKATTERLNTFLSPSEKINHRIIKEDMAELTKQVKKFEQIISKKADREEFDRLVPYQFLGDEVYNNHNYKKALLYYEKALIQEPPPLIKLSIMENMAWTYIWTDDLEKATEVTKNIISQFSKSYVGYWLKGYAFYAKNNNKDAIAYYTKALKLTPDCSYVRCQVLRSRSNSYLSEGNWNEVLLDVEKALKCDAPESFYASIKINMSFALKKLGDKEKAKKIIQEILPMIHLDYFIATAYAFLENKEKMLKELKNAIKRDAACKVAAKIDPKFSDYRDAPDFQNLIMINKI